MQKILIGFDPAPPGQYEVTKALCDSDFDGCVSAAILKNVYPQLELKFTDPGSVQCGKFDDWVDDKTVIADLPYVEGAGLYFDHHSGNKPAEAKPGRWSNTPCCAEILLDYFKDTKDLSRFKEVVYNLGKFDSGCVSLKDINDPDDYFMVGFTINRYDLKFENYFAEMLSNHTWEEVMADPKVKEQLDLTRQDISKYLDYVKSHTIVKNNLAILDNRNFSGRLGHSFFVAATFPETVGIVMFKKSKNCQRITMYQNTFNLKNGTKVDFSQIAKEINPKESGGHRGSCGFSLPLEANLDSTIEKIGSLVEKQLQS